MVTIDGLSPGELTDDTLQSIRTYRHDRVCRLLNEQGVPALLAYDPLNIRYITDARNMQVYAMCNDVRYVFLAADGHTVLFDWNNTVDFFANLSTIDEVREAETLSFFAEGETMIGVSESPTLKRWADEIVVLMREHCPDDMRLAVDRSNFRSVEALARRGITVIDGQEVLSRARAVKSEDEIDAIRMAVAACHDGFDRMQNAMRPGITEVELWSHLHQANIQWDGEFINARLMAAGQRTNPWMQEVGLNVIKSGDLVVCDSDMFGPYGYGADISRTWICDGRPTDRQRHLYRLSFEQTQGNVDLFRAGTSFKEIEAKNMRLPEEYMPQMFSSFAHGIGLGNEWPMIMTVGKSDAKGGYGGGYDGVLEAGMVMCIESYLGEVGGPDGVKLEQQILITDRAPEILSPFHIHDDWL